MEITSNDMMVFFSMSLAIVLLSLAAPPMNLTTDASQQAADIPEFNTTVDRFDFSTSFGDEPNGPARGELEFYDNGTKGGYGVNQLWLYGDTDNGTEIFLANDSSNARPEPNVTVNDWDSGSVVTKDEKTIQNVGDTATITQGENKIEFELVKNVSGPDSYLEAEYQIIQQERGKTWIDRIPVVGGIFSAQKQFEAVVAWIGAILLYLVTSAVELWLETVLVLVDMTGFLFGMFHWIFSTYTGIISAASGWAAAIVTVPVLLLSAELAKMVAVAISLLPTT